MQTTAIRLQEDQKIFLQQNYKNISDGVRECIDAARLPKDNESKELLNLIRQYSKRELKGVFTKKEWQFFFDSLNGTITDPKYRLSADTLISHCKDCEEFDGTATKWEVDVNLLEDKISKLTGAQVEAIYTFAEAFWSSDARDLEKWAYELS